MIQSCFIFRKSQNFSCRHGVWYTCQGFTVKVWLHLDTSKSQNASPNNLCLLRFFDDFSAKCWHKSNCNVILSESPSKVLTGIALLKSDRNLPNRILWIVFQPATILLGLWLLNFWGCIDFNFYTHARHSNGTSHLRLEGAHRRGMSGGEPSTSTSSEKESCWRHFRNLPYLKIKQPFWRCMEPMEHGDILTSYVSFPEGNMDVRNLITHRIHVWSIELQSIS